MANKYIYKKTSEDWFDPEYPNDIVGPCYFYDWTINELKTYDFTKQGGEIEEGFEFVDSVSEEPRGSQDKKYCGFPLLEDIPRDVVFNMGDNNIYITLTKVHWGCDGLQYKESVCINDDWEFEWEHAEFKVPKRFIKALEHWKKFIIKN